MQKRRPFVTNTDTVIKAIGLSVGTRRERKAQKTVPKTSSTCACSPRAALPKSSAGADVFREPDFQQMAAEPGTIDRDGHLGGETLAPSSMATHWEAENNARQNGRQFSSAERGTHSRSSSVWRCGFALADRVLISTANVELRHPL